MSARELVLFDDQKEIIGNIRAEMRNHKSILLQSPTGSGKTALAAYMIMSALEKMDGNIIFIVPRKTLLEQTSKSLTAYGVKHSFIASGRMYHPFTRVHIGIMNTMVRRIQGDVESGHFQTTLPPAKLVFIDESHFGTDGLTQVINYYKSIGAWVIGMSATPWRMDGTGMGKWYGTMVRGKSIRWLMDNGRLCDYSLYRGVELADLSQIKTASNGDYRIDQLDDYMSGHKKIVGDCVSEYKTRMMGNVHAVRCVSIKHSNIVAEMFRNEGLNFVHVDGTTPQGERSRIFKALARREILGLTFCDLLTFGFDLSQATGGMDITMESGSDLRPTKSLSSWMQWNGRFFRMKEKPAVLLDHVGNFERFGLPCAERNWTLESVDKCDYRAKSDSEDETPLRTRQCNNPARIDCRCVHKWSSTCPQCGYVYPPPTSSLKIKNVDGKMVEVDKNAAPNPKEAARRQARMRQGRAQTLDELIQIGKEKGYANPTVWASKVLAGRMMKNGRN